MLPDSLRLLAPLHCALELAVVAHEHPSGLECGVPGEAEVSPVDLAFGAERDPLAAPRILAGALEGHVEPDLTGHVANRQVTDHHELGAGLQLDPLEPTAHELDRS